MVFLENLYIGHFDSRYVACMDDFYDMSNHICTIILWRLLEQPYFSLLLLVKTIERRRKKSKDTIRVWKRELPKNYHEIVVQITFLFLHRVYYMYEWCFIIVAR